MGTDADADWHDQRQRAVDAHARAQRERKAREAAEAKQLIAAFLRDAGERGLATVALTAPAYEGRARYRTKLRGWYINRARSLAVDTDGEFYVLGVPNSIKARLTGADARPQPPPLIVGEGGKDGEAIALKELLQRLLDNGD